MNTKLQELWNNQVAKSHRVRLKRRHTRRHIPRPERNALELAGYITARNIRTLRELIEWRDKSGPMPSDYYKVFGSWSEAIKQAYPNRPLKLEPTASRERILQLVMQFGITTRDGYLKKRKEYPQLLCSWNQAKRIFGSWTELHNDAAKLSADIALARYVSLASRLKRQPTEDECRKWKVDLNPLRRIFGTKRQFDKFIALINEHAA